MNTPSGALPCAFCDGGRAAINFRIPFFADCPFQEFFDTGTAADLVVKIRPPVRLVVLEERRTVGNHPQFFENLQKLAIDTGLLRLVHDVPAAGPAAPNRVLIYEVTGGNP